VMREDEWRIFNISREILFAQLKPSITAAWKD